MTLGAGLPILMPITCLLFLFYFQIEKIILCRYSHRPPHASDNAITTAINMLPYAAILRSAIACWMYANNEIFPIQISTQGYEYTSANRLTSLQRSLEKLMPSFHIVFSRVCRTNVFPLFCLLISIVLIIIGIYSWRYFHLIWIKDLIEYYCCRHGIRLKSDENADFIHPYALHNMRHPLRQV